MKPVSRALYAVFFVALLFGSGVGFLLAERGVSMVENPADAWNAAFFMGYILAATAVLLLVLKFYSGKLLFTLLELVLEFFTLQIVAGLFLDDFYSLVAALVWVGLRLAFPVARSFFLGTGAVVVGALLGSSLDLIPCLALAVLLAVYDYYAVFKTKHMVKLAEALHKRGAAFAITVRAGKQWIQLGTGDLVVPVALVVSVLKESIIGGLFVFAGAMLGMTVLVWLLDQRKGYWPALPPIVGGLVVGLVAWFLVNPLVLKLVGA
ncbi:MAG: presenilin family intramembrane aspartyl protease [Candidatus Micrarchaeia archaeon]